MVLVNNFFTKPIFSYEQNHLKNIITVYYPGRLCHYGAVCAVVGNFDEGKYSGADIAWMIVATALVFPDDTGPGLFLWGMVNRKNVISTMIKSLIAAGLVSVFWIVVGYSLCFGESFHGLIGNPMTHFMFKGVNSGKPWVFMPTVPLTLICALSINVCDHYPRVWWWGLLPNE